MRMRCSELSEDIRREANGGRDPWPAFCLRQVDTGEKSTGTPTMLARPTRIPVHEPVPHSADIGRAIWAAGPDSKNAQVNDASRLKLDSKAECQNRIIRPAAAMQKAATSRDWSREK